MLVTMPRLFPVLHTNPNPSYTLNSEGRRQTGMYANIANLLDRQPPISAAYSSVQPGNFRVVLGNDVLGCSDTVGLRYRR